MYLEQHPTVAVNLLVLLSRRLRFAMQQTEHDEVPLTTVCRLARLLYDLVERYGIAEEGWMVLSIRLTQGELAGMMGCPRSETQAALEQLQQQGIIDLRGLQITVRNLDALRAAADHSG
jgi:CRP-like cAMP-binding protein